MLNKLKENLPTFEILLGYLMFLYFISETTISSAVLCLMFFIYIWLFTSLYLNQYTFTSFVYVLCGSGILVAISLFFLIGVEEVAYPQGALMFNAEGIAKSLFVFFISSLPLILANKENSFAEMFNLRSEIKKQKEAAPTYDENLWEEAAIEEVESGKFEAI
jgi:hypothetical protein